MIFTWFFHDFYLFFPWFYLFFPWFYLFFPWFYLFFPWFYLWNFWSGKWITYVEVESCGTRKVLGKRQEKTSVSPFFFSTWHFSKMNRFFRPTTSFAPRSNVKGRASLQSSAGRNREAAGTQDGHRRNANDCRGCPEGKNGEDESVFFWVFNMFNPVFSDMGVGQTPTRYLFLWMNKHPELFFTRSLGCSPRLQ